MTRGRDREAEARGRETAALAAAAAYAAACSEHLAAGRAEVREAAERRGKPGADARRRVLVARGARNRALAELLRAVCAYGGCGYGHPEIDDAGTGVTLPPVSRVTA